MEKETTEEEFDPRARTRELAAEFAKRNDAVGWFETLYKESGGDLDLIPWADMEPNRFLLQWAESNTLSGDGRTALVVGCGTGDDARFLHDLGFKVTAFDIAPTAIDWARRIHAGTDIIFETADLFKPPGAWLGAFDFVLEVYTIQPLPLEMRADVIDAIAAFVADGGELLVVTHGREDEEEIVQVPWPVSCADLSRFAANGLIETDFVEIMGDEEEPVVRFVVKYQRPAKAS